jgi:8-amino-7-oxononanoate synthase
MKRSATGPSTELASLAANAQRRVRRVVESRAAGDSILEPVVGGRRLVNFCSNDYLGLAGDPRLAEALCAAAARLGTGSGADRQPGRDSRCCRN